MKTITYLVTVALMCIAPICQGQEESNQIYIHGKKYLDINIKAREKYCKRVSRQQDKLLGKLKKKEARYAKKLARKDSLSYAHYRQNPLTYDSISKLQHQDSSPVFKRTSHLKNAGLDSLKAIKRFADNKAHVTGEGEGTGLNGYDERLNSLTVQQNKQQTINNLIDQRTRSLKDLSASSKLKPGEFKGIQKQVYYCKGKISSFKQMSDEPSKAEEKALEYLQGQEGFEKQFANNNSPNALQTTDFASPKLQMEANLKQKFGIDMPSAQSGIAKQVKQFQVNTKKISEAKGKAAVIKNNKTQFPTSVNISKLDFKVNPMRCLPFSKRIEKQLNYQTIRASNSGDPALFQLSAMVGYKQTPSLTYGIGIVSSTGLGQNWNNIHFTFQGVGIRPYVNWKWQYGFGAYGGYERMYKRTAFGSAAAETNHTSITNHNSTKFSESLLFGLTKNYRLSEKWNGQLQLLYDAWWKDKSLKTPIQIRFATIRNN